MRAQCSICGVVLLDDPTGLLDNAMWPLCYTREQPRQYCEVLRCATHFYDEEPDFQNSPWVRDPGARGPKEAFS